MTSKTNPAIFKVVLHQRVILSSDLIFEAERELDLPIPPFNGMRLCSTEWSPPDWDQSEEVIDMVYYNLKTGNVECFLPINDFREESSGSDDWTEEEVREKYRDWKLRRENRDGTMRPERDNGHD